MTETLNHPVRVDPHDRGTHPDPRDRPPRQAGRRRRLRDLRRDLRARHGPVGRRPPGHRLLPRSPSSTARRPTPPARCRAASSSARCGRATTRSSWPAASTGPCARCSRRPTGRGPDHHHGHELRPRERARHAGRHRLDGRAVHQQHALPGPGRDGARRPHRRAPRDQPDHRADGALDARPRRVRHEGRRDHGRGRRDGAVRGRDGRRHPPGPLCDHRDLRHDRRAAEARGQAQERRRRGRAEPVEGQGLRQPQGLRARAGRPRASTPRRTPARRSSRTPRPSCSSRSPRRPREGRQGDQGHVRRAGSRWSSASSSPTPAAAPTAAR